MSNMTEMSSSNNLWSMKITFSKTQCTQSWCLKVYNNGAFFSSYETIGINFPRINKLIQGKI